MSNPVNPKSDHLNLDSSLAVLLPLNGDPSSSRSSSIGSLSSNYSYQKAIGSISQPIISEEKNIEEEENPTGPIPVAVMCKANNTSSNADEEKIKEERFQ